MTRTLWKIVLVLNHVRDFDSWPLESMSDWWYFHIYRSSFLWRYTTRKTCGRINTNSIENRWSWLLFRSRWSSQTLTEGSWSGSVDLVTIYMVKFTPFPRSGCRVIEALYLRFFMVHPDRWSIKGPSKGLNDPRWRCLPPRRGGAVGLMAFLGRPDLGWCRT